MFFNFVGMNIDDAIRYASDNNVSLNVNYKYSYDTVLMPIEKVLKNKNENDIVNIEFSKCAIVAYLENSYPTIREVIYEYERTGKNPLGR